MRILLYFLFIYVFIYSSAIAGNSFYLTCNIEGTSISFYVNLDEKTVNGKVSIITDSIIDATLGVNSITINRFTGDITFISKNQCSGKDCIYYGNCYKSEVKKF